MLYLLSYDVQEDKRRTQICNYLKDCGYHLQKSVFILDCADREAAEGVFNRVKQLSDAQNDRIFMVPLCHQCFVRKLSSGPTIDFNEDLLIF